MTPAAPLPARLQDRPFRTAEAIGEQLSWARLPRAGLTHVSHGVWSARAPGSDEERARAMATALAGAGAYSHVTAAAVHGLPPPARLGSRTRFDVMTPTTAGQRRRAGWEGHRGLERRWVVAIRGIPVTDLIDTWIDLGCLAVGRKPLLDVDDLIIAGDEVINRLLAQQEWADDDAAARCRLPAHRDPVRVLRAVSQIRMRLAGRVRPRGRAALAAALDLLRAGVRSPMESRARLMFVHARFPEPAVNVDILARDGGGWLAEGDLVWEREKVVAEYQGEHHAARRQRSLDSARMILLHEQGWAVHEMWAEDLRPPRRGDLLRRVARSLGLQPGTVVID